MAGDLLDLDRFARQRSWNVERSGGAIGDAVAAMAEARDNEPLNHVPPR